jgi:hypothetical protein
MMMADCAVPFLGGIVMKAAFDAHPDGTAARAVRGADRVSTAGDFPRPAGQALRVFSFWGTALQCNIDGRQKA